MDMEPIDFNALKEKVDNRKDDVEQHYPATEDGIAQCFADEFADKLRYCHTAGKWFVWDGTRWHRDRRRLAFSYARQVGKKLGFDGKARECAGAERFAQSDQTLAVTHEVWDADPFQLGTPGGTVDLRTGELREADQGDFITKSTAVTPSKAACPLWLKFLNEATDGDADLIRFLQQWFGYSLTGSVREHALMFVYGPGGNGKSVFLNVMTKIMGDYADTAPMSTFQASKFDQHPTDLAMLAGARSVTASETEEGRVWAEAKIKSMTGGDPITARFMRQDFFTYQPQFKLLVVGNHKPQIRNVDDAMRRRFNIVPFVHKPPKPDKDLEAKLATELPAILQWAIEGCLDWQRNGLVRPKIVAEATDEYFSEQDMFGQWMEEFCVIDASIFGSSKNLFNSWKAFALDAGISAGTSKRFGSRLRQAGYEAGKRGDVRGWKGIQALWRDPGDFNDA